jgi:hypothetical protein
MSENNILEFKNKIKLDSLFSFTIYFIFANFWLGNFNISHD